MLRLLAVLLIGVVVVVAAAWLYTPDWPRTALIAAYAGPPSQFIDVLGARLHVRDTGPRDAPTLVLLHGFGSSLHTWDAWAAELDRDHRVIRYDLPGFGLTGEDPSGDYRDERSLAILLGLLDRLGVARASVVGNSMGGRIAWRFAAAHPERVAKLVLISPDGFASPGLAYGVAPDVPLLMRALPYVLPGFMLKATLAPAYADPRALTGALMERYRAMMLAPGVRRSIVARMGQQILVDPVPLLRTIAAPTLLLWGEKDAMIPFRNAADYLAALPHARLVALPGVGHVPQEEAPGTVATVRAFLDE
ncbi:MAG: alpha/beta fold hydrolase [Acetobacteraceae bacterium]|nr:alpha/beta fold hydrolase [Acetobacteraceae bacterium]